jgi:hypothetical protein
MVFGSRFSLLSIISCLLFFLAFPLSAQTGPSLELRAGDLQGEVQFQRADSTTWQPLEANDILQQGDQVKTGPAGAVTLTMPGISVTEIAPESNITIQALNRDKETRETLFGSEEITVNNIEMDVESGELDNAVENRSGSQTDYKLSTDGAVAGVRGTTFQMEREREGAVSVSVLDGQVSLYRPGNRDQGISVSENQRSTLGGRTQPAVEPLSEDVRRDLTSFRNNAQRGLAPPPVLSNLQLEGTSFEESISLSYGQSSSLMLEGNARIGVDGNSLSRVTIDGPSGQSTIELSGEQSDWSYQFSPNAPPEGERRTITLELNVTDNRGVTSATYERTVELVHPEERGDAGEVDVQRYETEGVSIDVTDQEARLLRDNPSVRSAIQSLEELRSAFLDKQPSALLDPVPAGVTIRTPQGELTQQQIRSRLNVLFPVLKSPSWTMTIDGITLDERTGQLRLNVSSTYGGQLVELLGVNPETLEGDPNNVSRKRPIESLEGQRKEQYVFGTGGGDATLQSLTPGWLMTRDILRSARRQLARWRIKSAVFGLFYYYEQESPGSFQTLVAPQFQNNDDNEFNHGRQDFLTSVESDFDNLGGIQHAVRVENIQFQGGFENARVDVNWDRNARLGNTNQLWQITDQSSTLIFQDDAGVMLSRLSGDPVFGLSSAQTQSTLIRGGTLDDQGSFSPKVVTSSGEVINFTGDLFPTLTGSKTTQIANQGCVSGSISSDPTSSQTWCGVEITNNITIPPGVVITVKQGSQVNVASGVTIFVEGEMDAQDCTFQPISGGWGENVAGGEKGIKVVPGTGSNGTLLLNNCSLTGVHGALELAAGAGSLNVEILNSTIEGLSDGTTRELITVNKNNSSILIENSTLRARRDGIKMSGSSQLDLIGSTLEPLNTPPSRYGINVAGNGADIDLRGNIIQSFLDANVSIRTQIVGFFSTENTYEGVSGNNGNIGVDYAPPNSSGISLVFENDIFFQHGSYAICNRRDGSTCGDPQQAVDPVEILYSDFIDNGTAAGSPAIDGGWPSFGPSSFMEGCYLENNNNSGSITTSTQTPDDGQLVIQYEDMSAVITPANSPNN